MLEMPTKGFGVSVDAHNVKLHCMCDWIEGSVTFTTDSVSKSDIVDILFEQNIYRSQDFAIERVEDAFTELSRRSTCLGKTSPWILSRRRVKRSSSWQECPAYSFCIMLSLQVLYRETFIDAFGDDYTEQGALFEQLTTESLEQSGWSACSTAWSKQASNAIVDKVNALAGHLGEPSRANGIAVD